VHYIQTRNPYEQEVAELEALQRAQQRARAQQALPSAPISAPSPMLASQPSFTAPAPAQMVSAPPPAAQKIAYGIEDVIRLMRDLPNGQQDAVVSIVQKTLMSMKVDISSILEDAARKIERLNKKNDKLSNEIRELEEAILKRRLEMEQNGRDMQETSDVQGSFQAVYATQRNPNERITQSTANLEPSSFSIAAANAQPAPFSLPHTLHKVS